MNLFANMTKNDLDQKQKNIFHEKLFILLYHQKMNDLLLPVLIFSSKSSDPYVRAHVSEISFDFIYDSWRYIKAKTFFEVFKDFFGSTIYLSFSFKQRWHVPDFYWNHKMLVFRNGLIQGYNICWVKTFFLIDDGERMTPVFFVSSFKKYILNLITKIQLISNPLRGIN